jgi:prepilin-type N-terminal cleavage/methylation domain-containing protein
MKKKRNNLKNQKGFTLIEIIAVLVILGVLAAVAIPKYLTLQQQAVNSAAYGATGAAASNVSAVYSNMLLNGTANITGTSLASNLGSTTYTNLGDYTATYTALAGYNVGINVSVVPVSGMQPTANNTKAVVIQP